MNKFGYEIYEDKSNEIGEQYLFKFDNNFGASVINNHMSYSSEDEPWELAVIKWYDDYSWYLCYTTPITDDVIGYLNDEEVEELLNEIKNLNEGE